MAETTSSLPDTKNEGSPLASLVDSAKELLLTVGETVREKAAAICPAVPQDLASAQRFAGAISGLALEMSRAATKSAITAITETILGKVPSTPADTGVEAIKGKKLVVWLVHPTNYRADGTPRKFERQILPTNAIAQIRALLPDKIRVGEEEISIEPHFLEDTAQAFDIDRIARSMQGEGVQGVVMLCGIQTNQWPRALNLAQLCHERGIPVVAGGYHVRADLPITQKQAVKYGISLAIGEAESVLADGSQFLIKILDDAWQGKLQPEYRQTENPGIESEKLPIVMPEYQGLMINPRMTTLESSRGCPLPCRFCTIRTIGGTEVRARTPDSMKAWLREQHQKYGIESVFITDDNFAKSRQRFEVLKILAELRQEGLRIGAMIQVDTMATLGAEGARFVEACERAGVYAVFLGIESIDPATLKSMDKPQNHPDRYKTIIDTWHKHNILTQCGFIVGSRHDTPGVGKRSAKALMDMGIDVAAAYVFTPLPGSVDYHRFHSEGTIVEPDFNTYDSHSRAYFDFPGGLSRAAVMQEYAAFYDEFYRLENISHLAERLHGETLIAALRQWFWYKFAIMKGDHPMYSGWGKLAPDYRRSDFNDNTPAKVSDLAPHPMGPGSPARERKRRLEVVS